MIVTSKFEIELAARPDSATVPEIQAYQQESYTRTVEFSLKEHGAQWNIPENASCLIRYIKPDGHGGVYSVLPDKSKAWRIAGNTITLTLVPQMMSTAGYVEASVVLLLGAEELTVTKFSVIVNRNPGADGMESTDYFNFQNMDEINTALISLLPLREMAKESPDYPGCYYRDVNGFTEWLNSPAVVGMEYRTDERYMQKPVYTKLIHCGAWAVNGTVDTQVSYGGKLIRYSGIIDNIPLPTIDASFDSPWSAWVQFGTNESHFVVNMRGGSGWSGRTAYVRIWYTKG